MINSLKPTSQKPENNFVQNFPKRNFSPQIRLLKKCQFEVKYRGERIFPFDKSKKLSKNQKLSSNFVRLRQRTIIYQSLLLSKGINVIFPTVVQYFIKQNMKISSSEECKNEQNDLFSKSSNSRTKIQNIWTKEEQMRFITYVSENKNNFTAKTKKRKYKVFKKLSQLLSGKSQIHCRTYFQTLLKKFKSIPKIKKHFQKEFGIEYFKSEYKFICSKIAENDDKKSFQNNGMQCSPSDLDDLLNQEVQVKPCEQLYHPLYFYQNVFSYNNMYPPFHNMPMEEWVKMEEVEGKAQK